MQKNRSIHPAKYVHPAAHQQKGGDTISTMQKHGQTYYYQDWRNYGGTVGHMLRFYFKKPNATIAEMSPASREAWFSCHRCIERLSQQEISVLRMYYTETWTDKKEQPHFLSVAERHGLTENETKRIINKAIRMVAIERGLADQ